LHIKYFANEHLHFICLFDNLEKYDKVIFALMLCDAVISVC